MKTCELLSECAEEYIRWPTIESLQEVAAGFEFPDTVGLFKNVFGMVAKTLQFMMLFYSGCVDSTDILLKQPLRHLPAYTNRKSVTSIKLQGICDSTLKFIDVSCGWPGSMHDARIFGMSLVGRTLGEKLENTPYHILGDSAYTLGVRLIKPYRDNGHLTAVINFMIQIVFLLFSSPNICSGSATL